jgi:hypothetical protein
LVFDQKFLSRGIDSAAGILPDALLIVCDVS